MVDYRNAYNENHVSFEISNIVWEDDYERLVGPDDEDIRTDEEINRLSLTEGGADLYRSIREENLSEIEEIEQTISFEYEAPAISVDTAGRFVSHEIIGGTTVRQKIGEDPVEVEIDGVCKESTARRIDNLRNAKYATIYSNRLPAGSLQVQFASTSTTPMSNSGAVGINDNGAEFLYNFSLSTVEVIV